MKPSAPSFFNQRIGLDPDAGAIEDLHRLATVGAGVVAHLIAAQLRPRLRGAGRIADPPGEIADQEDDLVTEVLEVSHLAQQHSVAEVDVRGARIEPDLDPQRAAPPPRPLQLGPQPLLGDQVDHPARQQLELLVDGGELLGLLLPRRHACSNRSPTASSFCSRRTSSRRSRTGRRTSSPRSCPSPPRFSLWP